MKWLWGCAVGVLLGAPLHAQHAADAGEVIQAIIGQLTDAGPEGTDYTEEQTRLEYLATHKLNLNTNSDETLRQLVFLSERDLLAIKRHRKLFGDFLSIYELQTVPELSEQTVMFLLCFVAVDDVQYDDPVSLWQLVKSGLHEFEVLYDVDGEQKKGYQPQVNTSKPAYRGNASREVFRYRFNYKSRLQFGYAGETDKGEAYALNKQQYGFDYSGVYFFYRPRKSWVQALALGDYQLCLGQGLMLNNGMAARRGNNITRVCLLQAPLKPYKSLNETGAWRGAALWLGKKRLQSILFFSRRKLSAGSFSDSAALVGAVSQSGLHRTQTEFEKRNNLTQVLYGGRIMYRVRNIQIGMQYASVAYDKAFTHGNEPYQLYQPEGNRFTNVGVDAYIPWRQGVWFGECAGDHAGAFAILAGGVTALGKRVDAVYLYRRYDKAYCSIGGNAFAAYNDGRNEEGMFGGLQMKLSSRWNLGVHCDLVRSFWLRYGKDFPERAAWYHTELQYTPDKLTQIQLRYLQQHLTDNTLIAGAFTPKVTPLRTAQYRLQVVWHPTPDWRVRSRAELIQNEANGSSANGVLVFQELHWKVPSLRWSIGAMVAVFKSEEGVRLYAAESDLPYQYSLTMYQGSGLRYYLLSRMALTPRLDFWLRYAQTSYAGVTETGSGTELVKGNTISVLRVALLLRFP